MEAAGGVEGVLGGAAVAAGGQESVLVAVAGGVVEGEAPPTRGAGVAQTHQLQALTIGQVVVDDELWLLDAAKQRWARYDGISVTYLG